MCNVYVLQGFDHHINNEHHIWAYIFFFIHLNDTKQCDYTSLELYVHKLVLSLALLLSLTVHFDVQPVNGIGVWTISETLAHCRTVAAQGRTDWTLSGDSS